MAIINEYIDISSELSVSSNITPHQEIDVSADTYANCSLSLSSSVDVSADTYANCSLSLSTLDATLANTRVSCSLDVASESSGDVSNTHINVVIGGYKVDISPGSLSISGNLGSRTVCSFQIPSTYPFSESYEIGAAVEIKDKSGNLIFGGTIDTDPFVVDNSGSVRTYQIQCVDYNQIADRHLVAYAYTTDSATRWYAGTIIKDIVERFFTYGGASENINVSNVQDGPQIDKAVFNYIQASQVFSELADIAGFVWYIDYDKKLYFYDSSANAAPFGVTETSENWRGMKVSNSREKYRNKQIIRGGDSLTEEREDSITAIIDQTLFEYPFPIGTASVVEENGTPKTLGVKGFDEGKDYYWSYDSPILEAAVAPGVGVVVKLTYQGLFPILISETLPNEIMARRAIEGGTGVYESIIDNNNITAQSTGVQVALAYLRKYGTIPKTIDFETDQTGLRTGQLLTVDIPSLDLDDDFLIESIGFSDYGGVLNRYKVHAVSGEALGGWLDFFNSLSRQTQNINLYDEDQVIILKTSEDTITLSDDATLYSTGTPDSYTNVAVSNFSETNYV